MSTNTIVGEMIAEHDAKQRKQPLPTSKEVHARMIEMTNAANGLRYEVARFGDIERQLKAVHEKMEPLVLKAKELNDLVCERVSQASQPWADSRIHESEELLQKVQQLEHENAALRADVLEQCMVNAKGGEREYSLRGRIEQLERENAALREKAERYRLVTLRQDADNTALCNKLAALENQTQWECSCGGTDCEGQKENAALREENAEWREMIREAVFDNNDILYWIRGARSILLDAVEKDRAAFNAARKEAQP